jgi:hypothetical protein
MKEVLKDIDRALADYPLLNLVINKKTIKIVGDIELVHPVLGKFDHYAVEIIIPKSYPKGFPLVIETSEKIPRTGSRHVNPDNSLCIAVEQEEKRITRNGITFKYFLDKVLIPHLSRETYRSINGSYSDGEYEHGDEGVWEYFKEKLNTNDENSIIKQLEQIVNSKWQDRNKPCFCESGSKFKKCHLPKWQLLLESGEGYLSNKIEFLKDKE